MKKDKLGETENKQRTSRADSSALLVRCESPCCVPSLVAIDFLALAGLFESEVRFGGLGSGSAAAAAAWPRLAKSFN
jgi:hypothetical protein